MALGVGPFDHGMACLVLDLGAHQLAIRLQHLRDHEPLAEERVTVDHAVDVDNFVVILVGEGAHILGLPFQPGLVSLNLFRAEDVFLQHPAMLGKMA